jgi:tRNA(fMet)-specific endonuclease VapC
VTLYVLDTDTLSLLQRGNQAICRQIAAHSNAEFAVSVISVEEQLSGWYTVIRQAKTKAKIAVLGAVCDPNTKIARAYTDLSACVESLAKLRVLPFNEQCIDQFEQLRTRKLSVRSMDLRIAATVLEFGGTLVTRNVQDFAQVPHLTIEDWSRSPLT